MACCGQCYRQFHKIVLTKETIFSRDLQASGQTGCPDPFAWDDSVNESSSAEAQTKKAERIALMTKVLTDKFGSHFKDGECGCEGRNCICLYPSGQPEVWKTVSVKFPNFKWDLLMDNGVTCKYVVAGFFDVKVRTDIGICLPNLEALSAD